MDLPERGENSEFEVRATANWREIAPEPSRPEIVAFTQPDYQSVGNFLPGPGDKVPACLGGATKIKN